MRNLIQLKQAKSIKPGEHILTPQHPTGVLLAHEVIKVGFLDLGKWTEITTDEIEKGRSHMVKSEAVVVVI